ncbi:cell division protein FtsA [Rickettsiales endosymbiont of Peranema trichophorum]|uniref:cell division protein FtsA n=1 Tax=Rickettsiales endosymbiont of Peranema trichophorum TaxID=2486577 RepID=UPI0010235B17|nr:cell division protein FtsA [Rickettsiales endosymbiont of Peranema trichophorum]RZI47692.1 cell division protein FtsA [Rickettsiales endosymbiont of Peranema trichophorum]
MSKQRKNVIAVLDLGSSKVVCFIAKISVHGRLEVLGVSHHISNGIRAGIVSDLKAIEKSILQSIEAAEKMAGERIHKVFISISSNNLLSHRVTSDITITGHEINAKDLNKLLFQILDRFNEQDMEVIHFFPYNYTLDGNRGIESPLGMYGNKLSCDFHILSGHTSTLLNIANSAAKSHLEVESYVSSSYASGLACLTPDERSLGVTLIEFGGGCTSISVFYNGWLIFTDGLPIGGISITNDLARVLCTDFASAERVKTLYGTVISSVSDSKEMIEVPLSNEDDSEMNIVQRSTVVEIIRARVEEILDIVAEKLENSRVGDLSGNKVVITGGTAQLSGIKELVGEKFSKTVRIGYPVVIDGLAENTSGLAFTAPIGMLLYVSEGIHKPNHFGMDNTNRHGSWFANLIEWLKQHFY